MDAVLVNPAQPISQEEADRLMAEYQATLDKLAAAGLKPPRAIRPPVSFQPTGQDEMMELVRQAWTDPNGSVLVFFPASGGARVVKRAPELEPAPARSPLYFTIHRTGTSKPTKVSPGGVKRNFGVALKIATYEDSTRLSKATGKTVNPGDVIASGYNVEASDPTETEV